MTLRTQRIPTRLGELLVLTPEEGVDLLLWPGVLFDHRLHLPLARALNAHGVRVGFIEPPGFGGSTMTRHDFSIEACGRTVVDVLDGLGLDRVAVGGTSWGGATSCWAGIVAPERIEATIAINAPFTAAKRAGFLGLFPHAIRMLPPAVIAATSPPNTLGRAALFRRSGEARRILQASLETATARDRTAAAERLFWYTEALLGNLDRLHVPTLIIAGRQDRLCLVRNAERATAEAPNAQLIVSEDTGHLTAWEDAGTTATQIADFLERTRAEE
jgi:pimeloyl-ACP methyl ester carboxylesterase